MMAITKTEYFDEDVMKSIGSDDRFNSSDLKRLKLYNRHRIDGGKVNVSYKFGQGCEEHQLGRIFPENGIGLQGFRWDFRNPLAKRWYWDIDIENCHYVIALKSCIDYNLPHSYISKYVHSRSTYLKMVSDDRTFAKTSFLKILYGGSIQLYREDYEDKEGRISEEGEAFLKNLKSEVDALMTTIWDTHPQYHKLRIGKEKKMISKKYNAKASLMSLIFQTKERILIMMFDKFLEANGRYLSVFIHDGGYVLKKEGETEFPTELLVEGAKYLNETLGYTAIKLTQKEITHNWVPKVKPFVKLATDDNHAAIILFEELKHSLIYYERQLFYKKNHIWINDPDLINDYLIDYILTSNIYMPSKKSEGDPVPYSQNISKAKNILVALLVKISTQKDTNVDIYMKLHTTTKGRLCFQDGVLDFKARRFYTWDEIDFEYYTTIMLKRNFKDYFNAPNLEVVNEIKTKIYDNLYGDDCTRALNALSRAFAGHCEDKNFIEYCGNRNCGKGIQFDNLKSAFGEYVSSFDLGYFLYNRKTPASSDPAPKLNYWIIDLQFVRLAISQETPAVEKSLKVNGQLWKKLCGGNDDHHCKRNYDKADTIVKIDTTFQVMGNNWLTYDSADVLEHSISFSSSVQFKSKEEIDEMIENGEDPRLISAYKVKDDTLRMKCLSEEWMNATVYLIYLNYVHNAVIPTKREFDKDDEDDINASSLRRIILTKFDFDGSAITPIKVVYDVLSDFQKSKVDTELKGMNILKQKCKSKSSEHRDKWCFYGVVLKSSPV